MCILQQEKYRPLPGERRQLLDQSGNNLLA
jgi:hypothetical protein